jgi:hypothetical protein
MRGRRVSTFLAAAPLPTCASSSPARFYPEGERTFYRLGRGGNFSHGLTDDEWSRQANAELLVVAMIRSVGSSARADAEVPASMRFTSARRTVAIAGHAAQSGCRQGRADDRLRRARIREALSMQHAPIEDLSPQMARHQNWRVNEKHPAAWVTLEGRVGAGAEDARPDFVSSLRRETLHDDSIRLPCWRPWSRFRLRRRPFPTNP